MSSPKPIQSPDPDQQSTVNYVQVGRPRGFSVSSSEEAPGQDKTNKARPLPSQAQTLIFKSQCSGCGTPLTQGQEVCTGIIDVPAYGPFLAQKIVCGRKKCTTPGCYRRTSSGECHVCSGDSVAMPLL